VVFVLVSCCAGALAVVIFETVTEMGAAGESAGNGNIED